MLESLGDATGQGKAATGVGEVWKAALAKRVATLFPREGASACGTEDPSGVGIEAHGEGGEEDPDLADRVALRTSETGGKILMVAEGETLHADAEVAAILRY